MTDAEKFNYTSSNQILNESDTLHLIRVADGNPTPNITWIRVSNNKAVSFPLIISGKQDEGGYRCNASNGVGSPDTRIVYVFVQSKLISKKIYFHREYYPSCVTSCNEFTRPAVFLST